MKLACSEVKFIFNNCLYKYIDGISMGFFLRPIISMTDIQWPIFPMTDNFKYLCRFYEYNLIKKTLYCTTNDFQRNFCYLHWWHSEKLITNNLYNNSEFTTENVVDTKLPFLDVLVHCDRKNVLHQCLQEKLLYWLLYTFYIIYV